MASLSATHRLDTAVRVLNNQAIACFSGAPFDILPMDFRVTSNPLSPIFKSAVAPRSSCARNAPPA